MNEILPNRTKVEIVGGEYIGRVGFIIYSRVAAKTIMYRVKLVGTGELIWQKGYKVKEYKYIPK